MGSLLNNPNANAVKFYKNCYRYSIRKYGHRETAEEFAAFAVIRYLESDNRGRPSWLWADFLRQRFGKRIPPPDAPFDEKYFAVDELTSSIVDISLLFSKLKGREQWLAYMIYSGFTLQEIGNKLDLSPERVRILLRNLRWRLK